MAESVSWTQTIFKWLAHARYNLTPSTAADNGVHELQCDSKGAVHVRVVGEGAEPGTVGSSSWTRTTSAIDRLSVKTASGKLLHVEGCNSSGSPFYIQVHDTPGTPTNGAIPVLSFAVPASGGVFSWDLPRGRSFTTGIHIIASTTMATLTIDASAAFFMAAEFV